MTNYKVLKEHYESCLKNHGPSVKGMDWPNQEDLDKRFKVLSEIIEYKPKSKSKIDILDLGCGIGLYIEYLKKQGILDSINYRGIDISPIMIENAQKLHPDNKFDVKDILVDGLIENCTDYIIMNGLFTEKREMSNDEMFAFFSQMIYQVYKACRKGFSFNVMSSHVDWQRDDLFHLELDKLVSYLTKNYTRNIVIRMDYGLYEYIVYVKK
jgi:SAM-dependent methyltransferase